MKYTITMNPQFSSVEINFDGKPSETVRTVLKEMHFRWHGAKKVWYGYEDEETVRTALDNVINGKTTRPEKKNKYGVKVGDIFYASWGYEQTNVNFFQVIALAGESSVRVREVYPKAIDEDYVSGMSVDRTYQLTSEILPAIDRPLFIEDQINGDLKRIHAGYYEDPEKANEHCYFKISSYASATKCNGDTFTTYESWYA